MSITLVTLQGDYLDELIAEHYGIGAVPAALEAVLAANLGLAQRGPVLPAGVRLVFPDITPASGTVVNLWD